MPLPIEQQTRQLMPYFLHAPFLAAIAICVLTCTAFAVAQAAEDATSPTSTTASLVVVPGVDDLPDPQGTPPSAHLPAPPSPKAALAAAPSAPAPLPPAPKVTAAPAINEAVIAKAAGPVNQAIDKAEAIEDANEKKLAAQKVEAEKARAKAEAVQAADKNAVPVVPAPTTSDAAANDVAKDDAE